VHEVKTDPLDPIRRADPELMDSISATRTLAFADGEISKKNKLLIALAIDATKNAENGVRSLAMQALESGATKAEIVETLRVVNYICGAGSMYTAAAALHDVL
jgi:alkylhydroperoxidase/carboxymuconolactone decarboxylase family protein YurZ